MGITDLLPEMAQAIMKAAINNLPPKVAIDISIWLHKIMAIPELNVLSYIKQQVRLLKSAGLQPILVFDGRTPGAKLGAVEKRRRDKAKIKLRAEQLEKDGDKEGAEKLRLQVQERSEKWQDELKKWCKLEGIHYVQAPFEADPEIAKLVELKIADAAITEDSDFIVYGIPKIMFKLKSGIGDLFDIDKVSECWGAAFDSDCFIAVCICMGCDYYLGGLYRFGKTLASKIYPRLTRPFQFDQLISLIDKHSKPKLIIPDDFKENFMRAFYTFKHQTVLDPLSGTFVPLTPYPEGKTKSDFEFAGSLYEGEPDFFLPPFPTVEAPDPILPIGIFQNLGNLVLKCLKCDETFTSVADLNGHKKIAHPFICCICQKQFECEKYLTDHLKTHGETKEYECDECPLTFFTEPLLKRHKQRVHGEALLLCKVCGKAFTRQDNLKAHELTHLEENQFACDICPATFSTASALGTHKRSQHSDKVLTCKICGREFNRKDTLANHILTHSAPKFICDICNKGYPNADSLRKHRNKVHFAKKEHVCSVCGKAFKTNFDLQRHTSVHTNAKPYKCPKCGNEYKDKRNLDKHFGKYPHHKE